MDALEKVVFQHECWVKNGFPKDTVPYRKAIDSFKILTHNMLKTIIGRPVTKYVPHQEFLWEHALVIDGLLCYYEDSKKANIYETVLGYYKKILEKSQKNIKVFTLSDQIMHGMNLLWLVENSQENMDVLLKEAVDYIKININEFGFLAYSQNEKDILYVDALGMICPFCVKYGMMYNDNEILDLGVNQLLYHIQNAIDEKTQLPYHAINIRTNEKLGSNSWGRGLGWMCYALSGVLQYLPEDNQNYDELKRYFISLSEYVTNSFTDGVLYNNLLLKDHVDTSSMAMIGASMALGVKTNVLPSKYIELPNKIANKIIDYVSSDGDVLSCSKDCMGIGQVAKEYSRFCAGGPTIKLLSIIQN